MDQARRWVTKYFSCLLGSVVLSGPTGITQSLQQRFVVSGVVILSACVQAGAGHFEHHFSHLYADLLTNLTLKCAN